MKKNILIAIVLCVFNSVAAFAQTEKEYSMIISLQNGSTVTLGHNDIKNITFTGDKINAEGNVVTTIEELKKVITMNDVRIQDHIAYLKSTIQDMQVMLKEQNAQISELANKLNEK